MDMHNGGVCAVRIFRYTQGQVNGMKYEQGAELMLDALRGIHGKFKKLYGQAAMRLNDSWESCPRYHTVAQLGKCAR